MHTYSRGYDQFPSNAPEILKRGKGAYVYITTIMNFLDYAMALRAVNIGYSDERVNKAAIKQIENGTILARTVANWASEAAETFIDMIDCVDMVNSLKMAQQLLVQR